MLTKMFKFNQTQDHLSAIITGIKQIFYVPFTSFIIILIMTLALFLATTFYILWQNIGPLHEKWNENTEISLYLKKKVGSKEAETLVKKLQLNPLVTKVKLIRPAEGIKTFTESTTLNALLSSFKENPLPNVIIVYPKVKILAKNVALELIKELNSFPEVEVVKADPDWIERGHNWLNLWDNLSWVFIFLLSINMFLVIGSLSYIYAKVFALRNDVTKIILQYQFAWLGLISSLLAMIWTQVILITLQNRGITLPGLTISWGIFMMLISVFLSFVSARVGANHLR